MKKNLFNTLVITLIAAITFMSCSKDSTTPNNGKSKTFRLNIPASFNATKAVADGGIATFSTSENVYILDEDAQSPGVGDNLLRPSTNGSSTTLIGEIGDNHLGIGDNAILAYNAVESSNSYYFKYNHQNGTIGGVVDGAIATVTVLNREEISEDVYNITTTPASFENAQSIYKFQFKVGGMGEPLNVKSVKISSAEDVLIQTYDLEDYVGNDYSDYGPIDVDCSTPLQTIYVALKFATIGVSETDEISFKVVDNEGKVYEGTKTSPVGGFQNGKFYKSGGVGVNNPIIIDVTEVSTLNPTLFSVSSTNQISFSPGNLVYNEGIWSFEATPFDNAGYGSLTPYSASTTSYFTWDNTDGKNVISTFETGNSVTVGGNTGWRLLSYNEWYYLLASRIMFGGARRFYHIDLGDSGLQEGLLLPPDGATSSDVSGLVAGGMTTDVDLDVYLAKGFVFLPAAGVYYNFGSGYEWSNDCEGYYWSNEEDDEDYACDMEFGTSSLYVDAGKKLSCMSVRLVHD